MEHIENIFNKYNTDKSSIFHNYTRQYNDLFNKYRDKSINVLEIGVLNGESIKALKEVFINGSIVGIDINPTCKQYESSDISVEIGNAADISFINKIYQKYGLFDIIIDDGSHINRDVIISFELLFPLLADNGLYIVEDTVVYKDSDYIDKRYPNHLEYFYQYVPFLNQWRYDSVDGIKDNCIDPFKISKKTNNVFEYSIDRIEYGCSYIAIHKKIKYHWIP